MSLDKSLNLSNAKKPQIVDQADARRKRLMKRIENQLIILMAVKNGEEPSKPYKRLARWWWSQEGKFYVYLQYARNPVELAKGKFSVECENLESVERAFKMLSKEVEQGQFDSLIADNSAKIRKRFEVKKSA
jgi:hypothetical protein